MSSSSPASAPPSRLIRLWREWLRPILVVLVLLGSFRSAVADWNDVPTGSMRPTILEGDRIFIDKHAYDWRVPFLGWRVAERSDPARGEIVIFPSPVDGVRLVKRVVGLPGDVIEVRNGRVLVNGAPLEYRLGSGTAGAALEEELGEHPHAVLAGGTLASLHDFGPATVPPAHYFMMGDNRDNSLDSRVFGAVAREKIEGRALAIALSVDPENWYLPRFGRWFRALR